MSTTSTPTVPRPTGSNLVCELHGLPLVAHVEAQLALAPDPTPEASEP
jgi:hypothetical protein